MAEKWLLCRCNWFSLVVYSSLATPSSKESGATLVYSCDFRQREVSDKYLTLKVNKRGIVNETQSCSKFSPYIIIISPLSLHQVHRPNFLSSSNS